MSHEFTGSSSTYFDKLKNTIDALDHAAFDKGVALVAEAQRNGQQIITLGNGGSALTALHLVTDWNKGVSRSTKLPFLGRTLVDNVGLISAYSNDHCYEDVFIEQLKNVMRKGDLVIAISGSGNSENVIRAVNYANENGGITLGLCGYSGGKLKDISQHAIWVNVNDMQIAEDVHCMFSHIVMQRLCGIA